MVTSENITSLTFNEIEDSLNDFISQIEIEITTPQTEKKILISRHILDYFRGIGNIFIMCGGNYSHFKLSYKKTIPHKDIKKFMDVVFYIDLRVKTSRTNTKLKSINLHSCGYGISIPFFKNTDGNIELVDTKTKYTFDVPYTNSIDSILNIFDETYLSNVLKENTK